MNELNQTLIPANHADPGRDWGSRQLRTLVLLLLTALGVVVCGVLSWPFLPALAWALGLAVLMCPFHRGLEARVKNANISALISVSLAALILVAPLVLVGQQLFRQAAAGAEVVKKKIQTREWRRELDAHPRLKQAAEMIEREVDVAGAVTNATNWLTTSVGAFLKGSVVQAIGVCLTFFLLFFFLRDRQVMLQSLQLVAPLSAGELNRLCGRVGEAIYATIYGAVAVAGLQGLLGGLMFWWLGLAAPLLWGTVMGILALVPVLGAFVVWIPAVIILAIQGSWLKAIILAVWGGVVVGTVDNLLRPVFVGNRVRIHTVLAFMSVVGGLMVFGSAGLILGPLAFTATLELLEVWRERNIVKAAPTKRIEPEDLARFENEGGAIVHEAGIMPRANPEAVCGLGTGRAVCSTP